MTKRAFALAFAALGAVVIVATTVVAVANLGGVTGLAESEKSATKPIEMTDIAQLKKAFNKDLGTPRLVLLLSPT